MSSQSPRKGLVPVLSKISIAYPWFRAASARHAGCHGRSWPLEETSGVWLCPFTCWHPACPCCQPSMTIIGAQSQTFTCGSILRQVFQLKPEPHWGGLLVSSHSWGSFSMVATLPASFTGTKPWGRGKRARSQTWHPHVPLPGVKVLVCVRPLGRGHGVCGDGPSLFPIALYLF